VGWLPGVVARQAAARAESAAEARAHDLLATVGLADYATAPAAILSYGAALSLLAIAAA